MTKNEVKDWLVNKGYVLGENNIYRKNYFNATKDLDVEIWFPDARDAMLVVVNDSCTGLHIANAWHSAGGIGCVGLSDMIKCEGFDL